MATNYTGSVRVDLLGGTLDFYPINLIIPNVVTLNVATSLKARVLLEEIDYDGVEIISKDYNSRYQFPSSDFTLANFTNDHFGVMKFVALILNEFKMIKKIRVSLESGSPAGAGLGGSSTMGVTLYSALAKHSKVDLDKKRAIQTVQDIEAQILNSGPPGYQDYYPALHGGVLGLLPKYGAICVEQLYSKELCTFLENHLTLVYSGETRLSGVNNWEVYKGFFDRKKESREGLEEIAKLSFAAYQAIKLQQFEKLPELISKEGAFRKELFPAILSPAMESLYNKLKLESSKIGMKVCGAGGGGCFLVVHPLEKKELVLDLVMKAKMSVLEFKIEEPIA